MPSQEEILRQLKLLDANRRTLDHYLQQKAMHGDAYVPPSVMHGIGEARANIQRIKAILRNWNVQVDDHPDDDEQIHNTASTNLPKATPAAPMPPVRSHDQTDDPSATSRTPTIHRRHTVPENVRQSGNRPTDAAPKGEHCISFTNCSLLGLVIVAMVIFVLQTSIAFVEVILAVVMFVVAVLVWIFPPLRNVLKQSWFGHVGVTVVLAIALLLVGYFNITALFRDDPNTPGPPNTAEATLMFIAVSGTVPSAAATATGDTGNLPAWTTVDPALAPPNGVVIDYLGHQQCDQPIQVLDKITAVLQNAGFQPVSDNAQMKVTSVHLSVSVECRADTRLKATIEFKSPSLYPVPLLPEPRTLRLTGHPEQVYAFIQASLLYSTGRYNTAFEQLTALRAASETLPSTPDRVDFYRLDGNIMLHLGRWEAAYTAYTAALEGLPEDPELLAARALTGLMARLSATDPSSSDIVARCAQISRKDLERALQKQATPELHILHGNTIIWCPRDDDPDYNEQADDAANNSLEAGDNGLAYALKARIAYSQSDVVVSRQWACKAITVDNSLPEPYLILGLANLRQGDPHGLAEGYFTQFAQRATYRWQINQGVIQWRAATDTHSLLEVQPEAVQPC